jgi:hypothetical protein
MNAEKNTYYSRNREKCLAKSKEYYKNNKEKALDYLKVYRSKNKAKIKDKQKVTRQKQKTYLKSLETENKHLIEENDELKQTIREFVEKQNIKDTSGAY